MYDGGAILAADPSTAPELLTTSLSSGAGELKNVLIVAVPAIIGVGAFFWAGRLALRKLGLGGKVAKI